MTAPDPSARVAEPAPVRGWQAFRRAYLFDYNRQATRLWLLLVAAGALSLAQAGWHLVGMAAGERWELGGWLLIVAIAAAFPIRIPRSKQSISTADVVIFLVLALHGTAAAVAAAALDGLVASSRTSSRLSSRLVSLATCALAMTLGGAAFALAQRALGAIGLPSPAAHLAALAVAAGLTWVVTSVSIMQVLCLKRGQRLGLRAWFDSHSWIGTLYLVSAVVAGVLSLNAQQFGRAAVGVGVLVIALSLALLRAHFRQQIAEHEAQEARVAAAELDARLSQRRFGSAFSQASIGMAIVDAEGDVLQANQALHELLGHAGGGLPGRPFASLLHAADAGLLERHVAGVLARREDRFSIELRCLAGGGHETWVLLHCALFDDEAGGGAGLIFQLHDISPRRRAEGELRHIAYHDALTDLANRNCFHERLAAAVERNRVGDGNGYAVMVLDIDRFKVVNDSLGHPAGDELLREVARRLAAHVRPTDLVARLGGDEFAVLLEDVPDPGAAVRLAERLLHELDRPATLHGTEVRTQASIGLTIGDMGYREPAEVLRDADLAMYHAKAGGKARLALFDASLREQIGQRLQLEADLRRAIGAGELTLAYQPLFELDPHRLNGFEALARWTHPQRGAISPAVFIALAEETGCIEALTAWAIAEAVRQLAEWRQLSDDGGELVIHVNISGRDLSQPRLVPHVREVLQRHGLPPHLLLLEITESMLMEHRERALQALHELGELGVRIGIDDFGTGYSSLAYLSTLPFDCLKIDRSFVIGLEKGPQNLEIVRTVISLGRSLNKQVVAEGIETREQLALLRRLGATIGQGYLLSRPLAPEQVRRLLHEPLPEPQVAG